MPGGILAVGRPGRRRPRIVEAIPAVLVLVREGGAVRGPCARVDRLIVRGPERVVRGNRVAAPGRTYPVVTGAVVAGRGGAHGAEARIEDLDTSSSRQVHGVEVTLVPVRSSRRGGVHDVIGRAAGGIVLGRVCVAVLRVSTWSRDRSPGAQALQASVPDAARGDAAVVGAGREAARPGRLIGYREDEATHAHVGQRAAHRHRHDVGGAGHARDRPGVDAKEPHEEGLHRHGDGHVQLPGVRRVWGHRDGRPAAGGVAVGGGNRVGPRRSVAQAAGHVHNPGKGRGIGCPLNLKAVAPGVGHVDGDADETDENGQHQGEDDDDLAGLFDPDLDRVQSRAYADVHLGQAHYCGGSIAIMVWSDIVIVPLPKRLPPTILIKDPRGVMN